MPDARRERRVHGDVSRDRNARARDDGRDRAAALRREGKYAARRRRMRRSAWSRRITACISRSWVELDQGRLSGYAARRRRGRAGAANHACTHPALARKRGEGWNSGRPRERGNIRTPNQHEAASLMQVTNYKAFWDDKASTTTGALLAVDGSASEEVARLTGAYTARQVASALDFEADRSRARARLRRRPHRLAARAEGRALGRRGHLREHARCRARSGWPGSSNVGFTELKRSRLDGLADASFDKAYCVAVFIHMDKEDFFLYLEELARVLKPGGLLYFDTWNLASTVGWRRFMLEVESASQRRSEPAQGRRAQPVLDARGSAHVPRARGLRAAADDERIAVGAGGRAEARRRRRCGGLARAPRERAPTRIAYTPLWTELFDRMLAVAHAGAPPQTMLDGLGDDSRGEEIPMFRTWFLDLWRHNQAHWGPPPGTREVAQSSRATACDAPIPRTREQRRNPSLRRLQYGPIRAHRSRAPEAIRKGRS